MQDAAQFGEQRVELCMEGIAPSGRDDGGHHVAVALGQRFEFVQIGCLSRCGLRGQADELVGDTAQGRHHHNNRPRRALDNPLDLSYTLGSSDRTPAKFQNFHRGGAEKMASLS